MVIAINIGPRGYQRIQTTEIFLTKKTCDQIYSMRFTEKSVENIWEWDNVGEGIVRGIQR